MIIFTLWVTGLGLLSSSSITLEKWLRCQIGWPSWLSRDNYGAKTASSIKVINGCTLSMDCTLTSSTSETQAGKKVINTK